MEHQLSTNKHQNIRTTYKSYCTCIFLYSYQGAKTYVLDTLK